eukprot:GEMP01009638.1.p1 GENE.GEMP01009638.1~~GEMP01009638.1.p1  ORF type:complete len:400 (+),score=85.95 GEMP01009638.1:410-1609(+)
MTGDFGVEERRKFFRQIDHMNKELQNARRMEKIAWDKEKKFSSQFILMSKRLMALEKGLGQIPMAQEHALEKYVTDLKADLLELQQASAQATKPVATIPSWAARGPASSGVASSVAELDTPPGPLTPTNDKSIKTFLHSATAFELGGTSQSSPGSPLRIPGANPVESTPSPSKASNQPTTPLSPSMPARPPHTPSKPSKQTGELGADAAVFDKPTIVSAETPENSEGMLSKTKGAEAAVAGEHETPSDNPLDNNENRSECLAGGVEDAERGQKHGVVRPGSELSVVKEHPGGLNPTHCPMANITSRGWQGLDSSLWKNVSNCEVCEVRFLLYRRHHCRKCGRCICSKCSPYRVPVQPTHPRHSRARSSDTRETADATTSSSMTGRNSFAHRVCKLCMLH